ncbi:MAG TPA: hypothetical protein VFV83_06630, partial [Chthoniobacteraceae bacterium]|nr:hypothetical protein [Chthoniobacteraceae bacterium]
MRCGLLEAEFDPAEGWLRRIRVQGREVIRAIYGAVRDRHWGTVAGRIHGLRIAQEPDQFRIVFKMEYVARDIHFRWRADIAGDKTSRITFRFAGEGISGFWKNRIGLCVLHPLENCAGERCRVETCDGSVRDATFPELIAPHQPFKNVRSLTTEAASNQRVEVRFEGDVFETEDQRNWTDASFKTYSTPLERPFPAWIAPASRVEQSVIVELTSAPASSSAAHSPATDVEL